jgi:hypothetical protein
LLVKTIHLILCLLYDPLKSTQFTGWSSLVEKVDIDMIWDGIFALIDSFQESRLSATVLAEQPISATICKFHGGIVEQDSAVKHQGD